MPRLNDQYKAQLEAALTRDVCKAVFTIISRCPLNETGIDIFAMNMIAREAGVSTGTLYNFFGDKDHLIARVIEESFADYRAAEARIASAVMPAEEKLRALCEALMSLPIEAHKIAYALSVKRRSLPEVQKTLEAMAQGSDKAVLSIMEQGLREGIFENIEAEPLTMEFTSLMDMFTEIGLFRCGRYSAGESAKTIMRLFMDGAGARPAAKRGRSEAANPARRPKCL